MRNLSMSTRLSGHALAGRGLEGYRLNEVHNSEWIEQAIRVNSVHPGHRDEPFRKLRHYVLPFHDDTVEVLTDSLEMSVVEGTIRSVLAELVHRMT